jgi:hypothetical protein
MSPPLVSGRAASAEDSRLFCIPLDEHGHEKRAPSRLADDEFAILALNYVFDDQRKGSANTVAASSKVTPCFRTFVEALAESHVKRTARKCMTLTEFGGKRFANGRSGVAIPLEVRSPREPTEPRDGEVVVERQHGAHRVSTTAKLTASV